MSWSIFLIDNTVEVDDECAEALLESVAATEYDWEEVDQFVMDGNLYFDPDYDEHMDYVADVADVLKKHKVGGMITFGSGEGDDAGEFWGYKFDGEGGMKNVKGALSWEDAE